MAEPKTVRLRNTETGVVVETSEENAEQLRGYEPADAKATSKRASSSKTEK